MKLEPYDKQRDVKGSADAREEDLVVLLKAPLRSFTSATFRAPVW